MVKIRSKANPFIIAEIRQLTRTRDQWRKPASKKEDPLHWNGYKFFRLGVKREIPVAEKAYVRAQIVESKGHSNSTWKVTNRCLLRKDQDGSMNFEDPTGLANRLKEFLTSVGGVSARKASELASQNEFNSNFEPLPPASVSSTSCQELFKLSETTEY